MSTALREDVTQRVTSSRPTNGITSLRQPAEDFSHHDEQTFNYPNVEGKVFKLDQANEAVRLAIKQPNLDETSQGLVFLSEPTLQAMLGLTLCAGDKTLFKAVAEHLGERAEPFSTDYNQTRAVFD